MIKSGSNCSTCPAMSNINYTLTWGPPEVLEYFKEYAESVQETETKGNNSGFILKPILC
jgi:hypothetical protein